jgi:hypothetical protein
LRVSSSNELLKVFPGIWSLPPAIAATGMPAYSSL